MITIMSFLAACGEADFNKGTQTNNAAAPTPPVPGYCPGKLDDPTGCIEAVCVRQGNTYSVHVRWCDGDASVQNVIRRKSTGSDWNMSEYRSLPGAQRTYIDTQVQLGQSWDYSQKYDPNLTTTIITVPISEACCFEF